MRVEVVEVDDGGLLYGALVFYSETDRITRGFSMYNESSSFIHGQGRSYKRDWTLPYRLIFEFVKPDSEELGEVDSERE